MILLSTAAVAGCYEQPLVPRDKPLRCTSADEAECPVGFRCIASGVCALVDCQTDEDCSEELICTERTGCDLPGAGDGGADGGTDAQGGLLPGTGTQPDAPVLLDSQPTLDGPGGGS
jgi:hypothetical protein